MPDRLTPPLPGRATALLAGIGALGAALVLLRVSEWGAGVGSDGAYFVSAAQNLQDGHGFVNYRGGAYTGLGPLLPLALAFLGLFGPDPVDAAGWLHAAAFGLTVFVAAVWVRARTRSVFLAGWAGLACALSLPLAHWASLVMTEPLFILFATLSLFALDRWLGGDRAMPGITGGRQLLFAAATAAALACATRYLGLALVACALPLVLTADRRGVPLGARAARAAIFAAVALAPIGAWMLRNLLLTGSSPTGTLHATGWDSLAAARTATGELARWVLGEGGYALLPSEGGASLAGALLAGVLIASAAFAWRRSDLRGGLLVPAAFAAAWIPAVLLSNWRYDFELLARYFAPLYPPLLAAAAIALGGLLREASLRGPRVRLPLPRRAGGTAASLPALALAAALALWLPQQALANYGDIRERRTDGWGYSGRHYAESETVRYLADRSLDGPFWSVTPQVTYLWTNERLRNYTLPGVLPADAHRWIAEARAEGREAWVVWPHIDSARRREYGVADLAALPGLEVAAVLEDGVVFRGSEDASGGSIAEALLRDARLLGSSRFDLWLDGDGKRLIFVREECAEDDEGSIFLDVYPAAGADPPAARRSGYETIQAWFERHGFREDGRCVFVRRLPEYGVAAVWTGQRREDGGERWSLRFPWPGTGARAAAGIDPGALRRAEPLAREPFEVYLDGRRLIYVREPCGADAVTPRFFLHVTPSDPADLPEERRGSGFDNLDFHFHEHGVLEDGRCVAVRELPRYGVASIRTGQWTRGEGEAWSVQAELGE